MKSMIAVVAFGAAIALASPIALAEDSTNHPENPTANVRDAHNYTEMVDHNAAFRAQREHKECDSIQSDDLRRQCIDSFGASAASGSSGERSTQTGVGRVTR
ncbi:MAG TPA: hypothetical protein VMB81_13950 [Candidatus Sulfotelmatobacter sp.]|nr:hypothetical protein [Candidatus Sulfotelmatobacter sp.]